MITIFNLIGGFGGSTNQINDVLFTFKKIQRTNANWELEAYPVGVTLTEARWEIRKMSDDSLVGLSFNTVASIAPIATPGYYYVVFKGKSSTDQYERRWDDIFNWYPKFTEAEADIVVDLAAGNYFTNFALADNSGLKIYVKGSGTGYFYPFGLLGSAGYSNYVRIQKEIGNTPIVQSPTGTVPIRPDACRYIMFDGYNDDGTRGWQIRSTNSQFEIRSQDNTTGCTNLHFMGLDIEGNNPAGQGAAIRLEVPAATASINASNFISLDNAIFDCRIANTGAEGIYLAYTNDNPQGGYTPPKMKNVVVAWNTIEDTNLDGIQPCSCVDIRVHDNTIDTWGLSLSQYHENAFSWNPGNSGRCYNNFCINGKVAFNASSGLYPYDIFNGQTTPQKLQVYNNVMIEGTPPVGGVTEPVFIYGQVSNTASTNEWPVEIFNNTIVCNKLCATWFFNSGGYTIPNFKFFNNICVRTGNAGDYNEIDWIGGGTYPATPTINNLLRTFASYSDLLFVDAPSRNYRITDLNSPVFTGASNLASLISGIPYIDGDGLPQLGDGDYAFGAYSGYGYKEITPTVDDAAAATFSVAPAVGSLTDTGGTFSFEANKLGLCYYVVVPNGDSPSIAQIMAGQNSSGSAALASGEILDAGTAPTDAFIGLVENTAYDLWCVFKTRDSIVQASPTKVDFTTAADVTAPVLSGWEVRNATPNRLYFNSSEIITGTTYGGFTISDIIGTAVTITGITINTGLLTDHYFTLSRNIVAADYLGKIAYSGSGSNIQDAASSPNALASFAATLITNSITYSKRINVNITNYALVNKPAWNDADFLGDYTTLRTVIANLDDINNTPTGYAFTLVDAFGALENSVNATGTYINETNAGARGLVVYNAVGATSQATVRFTGLPVGKLCDIIYATKSTFGSPTGTVNINGAGGVAYGSAYTEHLQKGIAVDGSGYVTLVMDNDVATTYTAITAIILIVYP